MVLHVVPKTSRRGETVSCPLLWKLAWYLLVLREGAFRSIPAQDPLGSVSEVYGIFSNRSLPSTSAKQQKETAVDYVLVVSCTALTNNTKEVLLSDIEVFIRWSDRLLEGVPSVPMRKVR